MKSWHWVIPAKGVDGAFKWAVLLSGERFLYLKI
jgi:hypothetical protein